MNDGSRRYSWAWCFLPSWTSIFCNTHLKRSWTSETQLKTLAAVLVLVWGLRCVLSHVSVWKESELWPITCGTRERPCEPSGSMTVTIQCFTIQWIITYNSAVVHWPVNMAVHTHAQTLTHLPSGEIMHKDGYGCTDSQTRETEHEPTLSCCWSSLLRRVNTALVSLFLRIAIWISFFCLGSSLRDKIRF